MASIKIPTPLRAYTNGEATITVNGATVQEAMADLVRQHPELRQQIYEGDTLRNFVNVYLGDEDIRFLNGIETAIEGDAKLRIIPSIAGGLGA